MIALAVMKKNMLAFFMAGLALLFTAGCVSTLDGHMRAGVPFLKDTIEGRYEKPVDEIFAAAKKVLEFNGALYGENTIKKTLEAKVDTRTVFVKIDEVEPGISRVRVQVRNKGGGTDIDLASEIEKQIALQLK
ncbi:MAG: hypothetical protein K9N48_01600 [Verrucomicrobia bacterium]|nr:hypothetical protein [Verrucomicrobiota bacterium]MCF7707437.1 hypothetical protein [Verrucomicrobiota bacterium]